MSRYINRDTGLVVKADFLGESVWFRIELPVSMEMSSRLMLPKAQFDQVFQAAPPIAEEAGQVAS